MAVPHEREVAEPWRASGTKCKKHLTSPTDHTNVPLAQWRRIELGGGCDDDGPAGVRSPLIVVWNDFGNEPDDDGDALLRRFWALPYKHKLIVNV